MNIEGRFELVVAVIDLDSIEIDIDQNTNDEDFYEIAKELQSLYSIGDFEQLINDQELDNLTNSYVRFLLVPLEKGNSIESVTRMALIVDNPKVTDQPVSYAV